MSYFDEPGAPQEYSATAGLGAVGPGIDISHYGAPYKGMLGLGGYAGGVGEYVSQPLGGLGMLYRYGAGMGWTPGPGQSPADDPRMVKQFTIVKAYYRVRGLSGDRNAARAGSVILAKARALYSGNTVRKLSGSGATGWVSGGRTGFEVILANPMRAGEIKRKNFQAGQQAGHEIGGGVAFYDASTSIPASGFEAAPSASPSEEAAAANGNFLTQRVAGLPVWAIGVIGLTVVGGLGYMALKPKKAAVAANRRRRRRRRRTTRR
jgi:hypothetical protein